MIGIIYSSGRHGGIDLSGAPAELRDVGRRVSGFLESRADVLSVPADADADPRPYDRAVRGLVVRKGGGPTRVRVTADGVMEVVGGLDALAVFAAYFRFDDDCPNGHHNHYEYFAGDDRIDPASVPLVIRVRRAAAGG